MRLTWVRAWVRRLVDDSEAWGFVCIMVFAVMGYIHSPLWVALLGGALFGVPSLVRMMLMVRDTKVKVPLSWELLSIYGRAIGHGVAAAVAGFFMGWGIRAYWGVVP